MVLLHERLQRRICRAVFLLMCAVPTAVVCASVMYFHRPWQEADWQRSLATDLHVETHIGHVTAPRPGQRTLHHVQLLDLRTGEELARCDQVRIEWKRVQVQQMELSINRLPAIARTVQTWLAGIFSTAGNVNIHRLLLTGQSQQHCTWENVSVVCSRGEGGLHKLALLAHAGEPSEEKSANKVRLLAEQRDDGTCTVQIDCRETTVPGWLVGHVAPGSALWQGSRFLGTVHLTAEHGSLQGYMQGDLSGIDAQTCLGTDAPHRCEATCQFELKKLKWHGEQLQSLEGKLTASDGTISPSLVEALGKHLFCKVAGGKTPGAEGHDLQFAELACSIHLDQKGLTVSGQCESGDGSEAGCVILSDSGPLLLQPRYSQLPLSRLVQVFCPLPANQEYLPATPEAVRLSRLLPLPASSAPTLR